MIRLSPEAEPEIYQTTRQFGTVLENVLMDPVTRRLNLDDDSLTEKYPRLLPHQSDQELRAFRHGRTSPEPDHADRRCLWVMPPVSRLTPEQAMYHFLSGYTAKVAGTERGMGNEPQATFSTCFGAPFMTRHPSVYANLLREKLADHKTHCWLVNTGWSGGPFGVGKRIRIAHTRTMVRAILNGQLASAPTKRDPIFGLQIPQTCDGVPAGILWPRSTWKNSADYDSKAKDLAERFEKNFEEFAPSVSPEVCTSGPKA